MAEVTAELLSAATSGDGDAFAELIAPFRGELRLHCYWILGSLTESPIGIRGGRPASPTGTAAVPAGWMRCSPPRSWSPSPYRMATTRS